MSAIRVFGKSLSASQLFSAHFMDSLLGQYPQQGRHLFYVEEITTDLLLAIEKLVYFEGFFRTSRNVAFVLDIPVLDRFIDPHALSSFPIFSYESPR